MIRPGTHQRNRKSCHQPPKAGRVEVMKRRDLQALLNEFTAIGKGIDRIRAILAAALDEAPAESSAAVLPFPASGRPTRQGAASPAVEDSGGSGSGGGLLDVLDLSGDIKRIHLALMRLGKGTVGQIHQATGLPADEIRIYVKTLERDGSVVRVQDGGAEAVFRPVMHKKRAGNVSTSLLDKLG